MIILNRLESLSFWQSTLIDAMLILALTFAVTYWFLFKPLVSQINKREQAESILKKSEERYKNIFQNVQDVYYEVTMDGTITEVSPSINIISKGQYNRRDLLGASVYDLYNDPAERDVLLAALSRDGEVRDYEINLKNRDGSLINCAISSRISFDNNQLPVKITGSMRDISVRKRAEENIRNMNEKLRLINSEKDKLFSIISHDLRSPLSSFIGLTEIMAKRGHKLNQAEQKKFSDSMHTSATNLYGLLENLLLWSRTKQGTLGFLLQRINLRQIVNEAISSLETTAAEKNIIMVSHISAETEVDADINSLQTIIRNLTSNAIKFTKHGGNISITSKPDKDKTQISITDTGIGMDSDMISKLFRIDGYINRQGTEGEPSTGLGLLLCHELVEKHGGKITVESEENKGSTFRFTI
jgi:PAS domain S-box-containing protein